MKWFVLLLLGSISAFASPRDDAEALLSRYQNVTQTNERLDLFSKQFLGLPYGMNGPLGEGETGTVDQDPLYRFDTFDCTTFVETTLSLSRARSVSDFETRMNAIRYEHSQVDYLKRNHFPSLQWIPNNLRNGIFVEANDDVLSPSDQLVAEAVIDIGGWILKTKLSSIQLPSATTIEKENALKILHARASEFKPSIARLNYLPISTLLARPDLLKKIPSGSVINFVRPNWDLTQSIGTHMNVSHQGLVFQTPHGTILRHASVSEKFVVETSLHHYLKSIENSPTLKGIHLLKPL